MKANKDTKPVVDRPSKALQDALKDDTVKKRFAELRTESVQERATPPILFLRSHAW